MTKLESEGWEFVFQDQGTLRSELTFRRAKPEIPWKPIGIGGGILALCIIGVLTVNMLGDADSSLDRGVALRSPAQSQPAPAATEVAPTEASSQPVETPPATSVVTPVTVDELLDKLNSAQMGGVFKGDQFRLSGEVFMSELWGTGATGEYTVLLKAQGGTQNLPVVRIH